MDYEKKYKDALERARQIQNTPYTAHWDVMKEVVEAVFPELAESKIERIRKWLICTLKSLNCSPVQIDGAYKMMLPAIDWLESLRPQNTWKPSDRELGAMLTAIGDERQKGSDVAKELLNIYQQLKKLREE